MRLSWQASQLKHGVSIVADLTKEEDMKRAVKETIEKLGGLDILVNRWAPLCTPHHGRHNHIFLIYPDLLFDIDMNVPGHPFEQQDTQPCTCITRCFKFSK